MFMHLFSYRLKALLRDRSVIFWTLMFPLVLATFFKLAFGNLANIDSFEPIKVAVVENAYYTEDTAFQMALDSLSGGDSPLLEVWVVSADNAKRDLDGDRIEGIIELVGPAAADKRLIVAGSGIGESILKSFLEQYAQSQLLLERIAKTDPAQVPAAVATLMKPQQFREEATLADQAKQDPVLNYYYSLLGMFCLYGAFFGTNEVNAIQANISTRAARVNLVPVHKLKVFLYSTAAAQLVHILEMMILLLYIRFALQIDFGDKWLLIAATSALSSFMGVAFGAFISALVKGNEGLKMAVILGVSMVGSMLSGMMFAGMKYLVAANAPVLKYINPVNLVTDAFYALYFYDDYSRYAINMTGLAIFAVAFSLGTYWLIRGRRYASL